MVIRLNVPTHILVAISAWVSRAIVAGSQLIAVRFLIEALGIEGYSVFAVLLGTSGWFMLLDLGIGVSVQNFISEKRACKENYLIWIVNASFAVTVLSILFVVVSYFISGYIGDSLFRNVAFLSNAQKWLLVFCASVMFISANVGNLMYKIWYAEQRGYLANIVPAIASVIGLVFIYQAKNLDLDLFQQLVYVILSYLLPNVVISCGCLISWLKGVKMTIDFSVIRQIMARARQFLVFGVMAAGVLQIDYIIISQTLATKDIVVYNVSTKIFGLVFFIYSAVLAALWPVCAEYLAVSKWEKVTAIIRRYIFYGIGVVFVSTVGLIFSIKYLVMLLSPNEQVYIPVSFIVLLGLYNIIRVWTDTFAMLLQSMNHLKPFLILVPLQAVISAASQWFLAGQFGYYGIVYGLILSFLLTVAWGLPMAFYKMRSKEVNL